MDILRNPSFDSEAALRDRALQFGLAAAAVAFSTGVWAFWRANQLLSDTPTNTSLMGTWHDLDLDILTISADQP